MGAFTALVLEEDGGSAIKTLDDDALPEGGVTVAVDYSSLNYKDGMVLNGLGNLVKSYPHVPGIDFAGTVEESESLDFKPGDEVILTGWRVGETHWGGYATRARVRPEWLVPLPQGLTLRRTMAIGTAGFTAMAAVMALEEHGLKAGGERQVLVTGAAGGVGGVAVALLSNLGHRVAASTGRSEAHAYLKDLGAAAIIERTELETPPAERRAVLEAFNRSEIKVVVTSRVLNEGVDMPAASVGIVLSGSSSVREHVQRLGRILRRQEGKEAVLYEVITRETSEEITSERRRDHDAYR